MTPEQQSRMGSPPVAPLPGRHSMNHLRTVVPSVLTECVYNPLPLLCTCPNPPSTWLGSDPPHPGLQSSPAAAGCTADGKCVSCTRFLCMCGPKQPNTQDKREGHRGCHCSGLTSSRASCARSPWARHRETHFAADVKRSQPHDDTAVRHAVATLTGLGMAVPHWHQISMPPIERLSE